MDAQCQETQCAQWHEREKSSCCPSHCTTSRHPQPEGMWPLHLLPCPQHPGACTSLPGHETCPLGPHPCTSWWRKHKNGLNIWVGGLNYAHGMHKPAGWPQEMCQGWERVFLAFPPAHSTYNHSFFGRSYWASRKKKGYFETTDYLDTTIVAANSPQGSVTCACPSGNRNSAREPLLLPISAPPRVPLMSSSSPAWASCFLPPAWRASKHCLVLPKGWLVLWGVLTKAKCILTASGEEPSRQSFSLHIQ